MPQMHRPVGCEPGEGCFHCKLKDCRYSGNRSKEERELYTGSKRETVGHGSMPPTHQRSGHVSHDWHGRR